MATYFVPPFVTVTNIGRRTLDGDDYVVANEATGQYFLANQSTVALMDSINRAGSIVAGVHAARMNPEVGKVIVEKLVRFGVLVQRGTTHQEKAVKAPIESKMISLRFDLIDGAALTRQLEWVGRIAYSKFGLFCWLLAVVAMMYFLLTNGDKAAFALQQVPQSGLADILRFVVLVVLLKIIHEMGHALAYRVMCLREGHDPGPIRMGIAIFAMTPFPFTDVTGAWRLRSKWRRAAIGAGGIYFELGATALLTIFWAQTNAGALQVTIFQVAIFTALTTVLFNFNPAVKLDGYYVMSDLSGQHNIAGRGSAAARDWLTRRLGGKAEAPEKPYLGYWLMSYSYRWILFGGIFWIFYQMDERLAVPVGIVIFMTLIGRPVYMSLRAAWRNGAKSMNMIIAGGLAAAVFGLCLVPLPDRLLLDGRLVVHDTRFVYAGETARVNLQDDAAGIELTNPELSFLSQDLNLRRAILDNAARSVTGSAQEQARLQNDAASLELISDELSQRLARLQVSAAPTEVWDLREAARYDGSWVRAQSSTPLAVLSQPAAPRVLVWLDQALVETDLLTRQDKSIRVRVASDPSCAFTADVTGQLADLIALENAFGLTAFPRDAGPACLANYPQGASVVARLETAPKSMFQRMQRSINRLLQNRLPTGNAEQRI